MKYIKYALGLLVVLMLATTGPRVVNAESCVTACLGEGAACLQQCLNPAETSQTEVSTKIEAAKPDGTIMLACTQLPVSCSSNSDCTCSSCCGDMAGVHICQPNC
jgi:hypothetical protein